MTGSSPAASRSGVKKAVGETERIGRRRIGWPDVLRVLPGDEERSEFLTRYRTGGWTPDDFNTRRQARECACDALAAVEDQSELLRTSKGREEERAAVREVRRRLEWELWP